jgi:hypothetical protein
LKNSGGFLHASAVALTGNSTVSFAYNDMLSGENIVLVLRLGCAVQRKQTESMNGVSFGLAFKCKGCLAHSTCHVRSTTKPIWNKMLTI